MPIKRVQEAIEEIKKGNMVIMIDDEDRENEGDLVYAATFSTPEKVNFMASKGKGLICVAVEKEAADRLKLVPMVARNEESMQTAFTVSVDAAAATTGISAHERDMAIKILADPLSAADELVRPGHIFPLVAKEGGVLTRTGHTEGSVDICKMAGLAGAGVICEIMKDDGTMARRDDLLKFAEEHGIKIVYIADMVEYRLRRESLVKKSEESEAEAFGASVIRMLFTDHFNRTHTVLCFGEPKKSIPVKFHNVGRDLDLVLNKEQYNGLLGSAEYLKEHGGVMVFLESHTDERATSKEFGVGAQILHHLGIETITLLTTKKTKEFVGINGFGLTVAEEIVIH